MLHAAALAELESSAEHNAGELWAHSYTILDPAALDSKSLETLLSSEKRVELLFSWIQQHVAENISTNVLSIPPPILSRSFQQLGRGMVGFHNAMKVSDVPFPFPYAQVCDTCLIAHFILTPIVTSVWVTNPVWSAVLCFIQIFVLWSLNFTAIEIENPYGKDANDINGSRMQETFNDQLCVLVSQHKKRTPTLSPKFVVSASRSSFESSKDELKLTKTASFKDLSHLTHPSRRFSVRCDERRAPEEEHRRVSVNSSSSWRSLEADKGSAPASQPGSLALAILAIQDSDEETPENELSDDTNGPANPVRENEDARALKTATIDEERSSHDFSVDQPSDITEHCERL